MGGIIAYVLFFIAGVGFGYAAAGKWQLAAAAVPARARRSCAVFEVRASTASVAHPADRRAGRSPRSAFCSAPLIDARGERAGEHARGYA